MEELINIGSVSNIVRETSAAVLFKIGVSNLGHPIERFVPKSQMYERYHSVYVPKWLARKMGIWCGDNLDAYTRQGYTKMYDDDTDDLPF